MYLLTEKSNNKTKKNKPEKKDKDERRGEKNRQTKITIINNKSMPKISLVNLI